MIKQAAKKTGRSTAKQANKPAREPAAKTAAKPVTKSVTKRPAEKKAAPQSAAKRPVGRPADANKKAARPAKDDKPKKTKIVRDSFTMPDTEYALIGAVKKACLSAGFEIKKSEILRIGVTLLAKLDPNKIKAAQAALVPLKAAVRKSTNNPAPPAARPQPGLSARVSRTTDVIKRSQSRVLI